MYIVLQKKKLKGEGLIEVCRECIII